MQTEPYYIALIACDRAKIIDSNILNALAIPIEGAGDDSSSRGRICSFGAKSSTSVKYFDPMAVCAGFMQRATTA